MIIKIMLRMGYDDMLLRCALFTALALFAGTITELFFAVSAAPESAIPQVHMQSVNKQRHVR